MTTHKDQLNSLFGLDTDLDFRYGLDKAQLFQEALANDLGRIREGGPDDEHKAYQTSLGADGPLIFYTDPSCTGRPVKDTFGVAWPELVSSPRSIRLTPWVRSPLIVPVKRSE